MATIKINNLSVTGSEFFSDSESYLDQLTDLSERDVLSIQGGLIITTPTTTIPTTTIPTITTTPTTTRTPPTTWYC
ncbi:hypothetical protein [Nostoc sp. FACHB-280]|uniref:hypothetical protein n=1 Tax=Nostoc sp. FACHB-280 TaxID=2692839 RepID=UPI00168B4422|nr:hypothetical protein [Nostoc sp. FACHB-280]MBD2495833.1 hypothetical protein [Nostoc sp. FACHB-280]